jgi:hypothetical protein
VTVVQYGANPQDQDKPWRGQSTYPVATVAGTAAFVPRTQLVGTFAEQKEGVLRESEYALFAADADDGYHLEEFDAIIDRDMTWRILKTEVISPAEKRVLYMFEVSR